MAKKYSREWWSGKAKEQLANRMIVDAGYVDDPDVGCTLSFTLDNGVQYFVMADDEGNDAGSLHSSAADKMLPRVR